MSKFLKVTDKFKYDCLIAINKDLVDLVEDDSNGGSKITSFKACIALNANETVGQVMKQMEE